MKKLAFTAEKIYTVDQAGLLKNGIMLVENDKIVAIGQNIDVPSDYTLVDFGSNNIMPGMVEAHSHLIAHDWNHAEDSYESGGSGGGLGRACVPAADYYYHFDPKHRHLDDALAGGVTTANILPGSGKIITGTGFVAKMHGKTRTREDLVIVRNSGVKMALGENPKRAIGSTGAIPKTRMGSAAVLRNALFKAQEYMEKKEKAAQEGKDFKINMELEPLIPLLKREVPCRVHAHRSDDMMTAMRIGDEFNIIVILEHTTSGHLIAEEIAKRKIMCTLGPTMGSRSKQEVHAKGYNTAKVLEDAGITFALTTDASVLAIELLRLAGSLAWREGLSEEGTFKSVTINGAKLIGLEDRLGSLAVGKDADFAVYDGHPLSLRSSVLETWVNGVKAWDRKTWLEPWQRKI